MTDPALRDSYNEIILDGMPLKLRGTMPDSNLATFQRKMVIGDYDKDSNPLLSSWVISDLSGGHGVYDMHEASDSTRYRIGDFNTRYAGQIASPDYSVSFSTSPGIYARYLGDLFYLNVWYAMIAIEGVGGYASLYRRSWNPSVMQPAGTINEPRGHSVAFRGLAADTYLVVPTGVKGYSVIRQTDLAVTNFAPSITVPAMLDVAMWDEKLIGIDLDGQLWWAINPLGPWTSYGSTSKLPTAEVPHRLISFFDRNGQPCIFVLTERRLWQFDPSGPQIFTVDVQFPPGPHQGLSGDKWSGDLYFSVGMGVHRYTGGALSAIGLDRDNGIPLEYNGWIVDMAAGYNSLYALVTQPDLTPYTFPAGAPTPVSSLHEWSGSGWRMIWSKAGVTAAPYSMGISRASGGQLLIWGAPGFRPLLRGITSWNCRPPLPIPANAARPLHSRPRAASWNRRSLMPGCRGTRRSPPHWT